MTKWTKQYNNDTGPDDDYFEEWFEITDGKRIFRCEEREDVDFLLSILSQQGEPVAWIYEDELPEGYPYDAMFERSRVIDGVRMFPVNVAPPRQPLTDEEILKVWEQAIVQDNGAHARLDNQPFVHFARAIEAKLKEKNT